MAKLMQDNAYVIVCSTVKHSQACSAEDDQATRQNGVQVEQWPPLLFRQRAECCHAVCPLIAITGCPSVRTHCPAGNDPEQLLLPELQ